ncbi:MAG TPA: TonB family protein [Longimicrobium sp.]|nr:TonB family protein [Longimicrobium sp.]
MHIPSIARGFIPLLLLGGVIPPVQAAAQPDPRHRDVRVGFEMNEATGYDRPYAIVFARGQPRDGVLMWSCGEDPQRYVVGVRLAEDGAEGATRRMAWSVDGGAPDTTVVQGVAGNRVWFVRDEDANAIPERMRGASRMSIRVARGDAPGQDVEYTYGLAGVDSALIQLACDGNDADLAEALTGRQVLLKLSREPRMGRNGRLEFDPRPREWWPQLLNHDEVAMSVVRRYPAGLRDRGVNGEVLLRFFVQQDGRVAPGSARTLRATHVGFIPAAATIVEGMRFRPARRNGQVVGVWVTQPIQFRVHR